MASKLYCACDFLSYEEGILLYNALQETGISALVKSSGPPSIPFGEGQYYQLLVPEEDLEMATEIAVNFKKQVTEARAVVRCPACRSEAVFKAENLPFWQRLYYAGTVVYKCATCQKIFSR